MKLDPKAITTILGTVAIGACAIILVVRGDLAHASTFAALLVPSLSQIGGTPAASPLAMAVRP